MSKTSDVLVQRQIPKVSGYSSIWTNLGKIGNKGIELALHSVNFRGEFRWTSQITFSLNRNKILKLYGNGIKGRRNEWFVGEPISAIYDYKILGVWQEKALFNGTIYEGWFPGQYHYADLNHDGKITPSEDRTIIGYRAPSYRFGIGNRLSYKGFTLFIFINSIQGGKNHYLANNAFFINHPYKFPYRKNMSAINPYWTPLNPTHNTTSLYGTPPVRSGVYQNRSFIRLQDISFAYSLPDEVLNNFGLKEAQVYITSHNTYVWTEWQGFDPEIGPSNTPLMRNIMFGIKASF